jgi:hypothetical protein
MKPKTTPRADGTLCVQAGEERHGRATSLTTDIAQTSVFVLPNIEELRRLALATFQPVL